MRTGLDVLQPQHAFLDRILHDETLHKHILFLSKTMDAVVCLRLGRKIPREIHAMIDYDYDQKGFN